MSVAAPDSRLLQCLVLSRALAPKFFDGFVTQLEERLVDPEYVGLWKRSWDADDPRLDKLASAMADNLRTDRALMEAINRVTS